MKLLTILKSSLISPLFTRSLWVGTLLSLFFAVPIYWIATHFAADQRRQEVKAERVANQGILKNIFESQARYGDLVNARTYTLEKARHLGLKGIVLCENGIEVLAKFNSGGCGSRSPDENIQISGRQIDFLFDWDDSRFGNSQIKTLGMVLSVFVLIAVIFTSVLSTYLFSRRSLMQFSVKLSELAANDGIPDFPKMPELLPVIDALRRLKELISDYRLRETELALSKELSSISRQVAHDIRSPLTALEVLVQSTQGLNIDQQDLIRSAISRIKEIANDLLNRSGQGNPSLNEEIAISCDVYLLTRELVSEKKNQFGSRAGMNIRLSVSPSRDGYTSIIQPANFKRMLSNLIDNAIESIEHKGEIDIKLDLIQDLIRLTVSDSGKGIPKDVLPSLGLKQISYGKKSGNGLGLTHAFKTIKSWNGKILIDSIPRIGTKITVLLNSGMANPLTLHSSARSNENFNRSEAQI